MSRSKTIAIFTLGFMGWAAGAMAVSVYGFDQYERAWGRGPSYQVGFKCSAVEVSCVLKKP